MQFVVFKTILIMPSAFPFQSFEIIIHYSVTATRLQEDGVPFLAGARDFSLFHGVETGSEAHPASYPVGTEESFPSSLN
jgi:hypothetical protein